MITWFPLRMGTCNLPIKHAARVVTGLYYNCNGFVSAGLRFKLFINPHVLKNLKRSSEWVNIYPFGGSYLTLNSYPEKVGRDFCWADLLPYIVIYITDLPIIAI